MTVLAGSRYANSSVVTVVAPDTFGGGDISVIVPGMGQPYTFQYTSYQVIAGDRIDNIAFQHLGNAALWWAIANVNPEVLWWDDLTPGTILRIPAT